MASRQFRRLFTSSTRKSFFAVTTGTVGEPAKHNLVILAKGEHLADRGRHCGLAERCNGGGDFEDSAVFAIAASLDCDTIPCNIFAW